MLLRTPPQPMMPPNAPVWWLALAALLVSAALALPLRPMGHELVRFGTVTALLPVVMLVSMTLASCGGGSAPPLNLGTPAGTYSLTVTATATSGSATLAHNITLTLTVN
jgi:hypothetical protein